MARGISRLPIRTSASLQSFGPTKTVPDEKRKPAKWRARKDSNRAVSWEGARMISTIRPEIQANPLDGGLR
jgi:hypothetical protein